MNVFVWRSDGWLVTGDDGNMETRINFQVAFDDDGEIFMNYSKQNTEHNREK